MVVVLFGLVRFVGFFTSKSAGRFGDENENGFRLLFRFPELSEIGEFFLPPDPATKAGLFPVKFEDDNFSSVSESDGKS